MAHYLDFVGDQTRAINAVLGRPYQASDIFVSSTDKLAKYSKAAALSGSKADYVKIKNHIDPQVFEAISTAVWDHPSQGHWKHLVCYPSFWTCYIDF